MLPAPTLNVPALVIAEVAGVEMLNPLEVVMFTTPPARLLNVPLLRLRGAAARLKDRHSDRTSLACAAVSARLRRV